MGLREFFFWDTLYISPILITFDFDRIPKSLSQNMGITSDEEDEESTPIIRKEFFYRLLILSHFLNFIFFQIYTFSRYLHIFENIGFYWLHVADCATFVYILAH